jgi:hypothetical protein
MAGVGRILADGSGQLYEMFEPGFLDLASDQSQFSIYRITDLHDVHGKDIGYIVAGGRRPEGGRMARWQSRRRIQHRVERRWQILVCGGRQRWLGRRTVPTRRGQPVHPAIARWRRPR